MPDDLLFDALLLGGRAGAGKTTVGWEISVQLQAARIAHCLIEGDNLDQAFPAPPGDPGLVWYHVDTNPAMSRLGTRTLERLQAARLTMDAPNMLARGSGAGGVVVTAWPLDGRECHIHALVSGEGQFRVGRTGA